MQTVTVHDVYVNGVLFIMELTLNDEGTGYMTLTEACNHLTDPDCEGHQTYDFKEVE